jgi:hypothetical protein
MRSFTLLAASLLLAASTLACGDSTTAASTTTTTTTENFNSVLAVGGNTSRAFTMTTAGTITVTLTTFGSGTQKAGLGIGVPTAALGSPCSVTQSTITTAGASPQITTTADAGTYCVQIYDTGSIVGDTGFQIAIVHP